MAVFNLDDNAFLRSRFQGHAASRVVTKTTQSLAQAGNLDGHIVVHSKVWSATNDQFVKHTTDAMRGTTNGLNATIDLVTIFKGLEGTVACTTDKAGNPLPANLSGKVYRNPAYPAIELYDGVLMTGVAGSNAVGSGATARYESYEILNGSARVMDWIPPTAVADGTYPVVPGYTGRVEVCKDAAPTASSVWTDLENCGDVSGAWALDQSNWEFVYMAGMVKFHPDCTPIGKGYKSIRFTGFKYIGSVLSDTLASLQNNVEQNIGANLNLVAGRVTDLETATADLPTIRTNISGLQSGKVDKVTGSSLVADTEISKLAQYPAYSAVQEAIAAMADPQEVTAAINAALTAYYTSAQVDGIVDGINAKLVNVFKYIGVVDNVALLPASNAEGLAVGHVYHVSYEYSLTTDATFVEGTTYYTVADGVYTAASVTAGEAVTASTYYVRRQLNAEFAWNGTRWEDLGGIIDLSAYATKAYVDGLVSAEAATARAAEQANADAISGEISRATGEESRIEGLVTAEASRAAGEEARIEGLVTAEASRAAGEEQRIEGLVTAEATAARAAEAANAAAITAEETRAKGEEDRIEGLVTTEAATARAAEQANAAAITTEAATARAAEQANANAISAEEQARAAADEDLQDAIDAEAQTRESADNANSTAISNEETRAKGEEARIEGLVTAEAAAARAAEGANATAIGNEVTRATGEEARIEGLVTAEATTARAAEQANAAAIAAETAAREAAVSGINTALAGKTNVTTVQYLTSGTDNAPQAVNLVVDTWYIVKAPFTGTLPTAPADGTIIKVSTLVGGDKRRLVAGTGDTILGSANPCAIGITEDGLSLDTENYVFLYIAADHNWVVL